MLMVRLFFFNFSFCLQDVLNLYKGKKYFLVIGHSFGNVVALDLVKMLEKNGLVGQFIAIDGSLMLFKKFLKTLMSDGEPTIESIQDFLLVQLAFEILPEQKPEIIRNVLDEEKTWEARMDKYISLMARTDYSSEYLKQIGKGVQNRFKVILKAKDENVGQKIKENITLIRPSTFLVQNIEDNYGLQHYTDGAVILHYIDGTHLSMLDNPKLPVMINEMSEKTIKR